MLLVETTTYRKPSHSSSGSETPLSGGRETISVTNQNVRVAKQDKNPENKASKDISFREYVESSRNNCPDILGRRVADSLSAVMSADGLENLDLRTLGIWLATSLRNGLNRLSALRYLGRLNTLCNAWIQSDSVELQEWFAKLRGFLQSDDVESSPLSPDVMKAAKTLLLKSDGLDADCDAFKFIIYSGAGSLGEAINQKLDVDFPRLPQLESLRKAVESPRRKYWFALGQGKNRERALADSLCARLTFRLLEAGAPATFRFNIESARAIWLESALQAGISFEELSNVFSVFPPGYRWLSILSSGKEIQAPSLEVLSRVADGLNPNVKSWFALKLRQRVTVQQFAKALIESGCSFREEDLLQPIRRVSRREGKKIIHEEVPVIPSLAFLRAYPGKMRELMGKVGDLAWCYRSGRNNSGDYTRIPERDMKALLIAVGGGSDLIIEETDLSAYTPGKLARILTGPMAGMTAEITDSSKTNVILRLSTDTALRWSISLPPTALRIMDNRLLTMDNYPFSLDP